MTRSHFLGFTPQDRPRFSPASVAARAATFREPWLTVCAPRPFIGRPWFRVMALLEVNGRLEWEVVGELQQRGTLPNFHDNLGITSSTPPRVELVLMDWDFNSRNLRGRTADELLPMLDCGIADIRSRAIEALAHVRPPRSRKKPRTIVQLGLGV